MPIVRLTMPTTIETTASIGRRGASDASTRIGLVTLQGRQDQRSPEAGGHADRAGRRIGGRHARHDRVLDRRHLVDPEAKRCRRRRAGGGAVRCIGDGADGLPGQHDETVIDRGLIDRDRIEALADLEVDCLALLVDGRPSAAIPSWNRSRRRTSGRWASSSNSSAASMRPWIAT
jgi:hypothetical protein